MANDRKQSEEIRRRRHAIRLRLHDMPDDITVTEVRAMLSGRGRVGRVRIESRRPNETVACFELHDSIIDKEDEPIRWNGEKLIMEDGWDWQ